MSANKESENSDKQNEGVSETAQIEHPASDLTNVEEKPEIGASLSGSYSLIKVSSIGLVVAIFFTSLFLNFSYILGSETETSTQSTTHWFLVFGLICITAISLTISFWNYHIRSVYLKDGPALVPEKWGQILLELIDAWKLQHSQSQSSLVLTGTLKNRQKVE